MNRFTTAVVLLATTFFATIDAHARKWVGPDGKLIEANLVVIREASVIVRLPGHEVRVIEIPDRDLRELDRRYLARRGYGRWRLVASVGRVGRGPEFKLIDEHALYPAGLVRVVNYLNGLGRDRAFEILHAYSYGGIEDWHAQKRIAVIIPLLFEPMNKGEKLPRSDFNGGYSLDLDDWSDSFDFQITMSHNLPFDTRGGGLSSGPAPRGDYLLRWASEHGQLGAPIRPGNDPLAAADELASHFRSSSFRRPAWRSVEHLFPLAWQCTFSAQLDDARWSLLKELAAELQIAWDHKQQQYVATNPVGLPSPSIGIFPRDLDGPRRR